MSLGRTVRELRAALTGQEYRKWRLYYDTEPFGFQREEARFATIMCGLFATGSGKPSPEMLQTDHWKYSKPKQRSDEELHNIFKSSFGLA